MTRYNHDTASLQLAVSGAEPRPALIELQLSPRCQLRCSYCHSMAPARSTTVYGTTSEPLMRLADYETLLASFRDLGGQEMVISGGGEPLLHPDAAEVLELATTLACTHLYTNGLHPMLADASQRWVRELASVRISFHTGLAQQQIAQLASAATAVTQQRGDGKPTTLSILVGSITEPEIRALAAALPLGQLTGIELRSDLAGPSIPADQAARWCQLVEKLGGVILDTRVGPVPVPQACYAPYRSIVVDPFGGYRVCCMRAHLPEGDAAHLGNARHTPLDQALSAGRAALPHLGAKLCHQCSARDSAFSDQVRRLRRGERP